MIIISSKTNKVRAPRHLLIDPTGAGGDCSSILEATEYAVAKGISSAQRWLFECLPGQLTEPDLPVGADIDVPNFVTLRGPGGILGSIMRPVLVHGRSVVKGFNFVVSSPYKYVVRVAHDVASGFTFIADCHLGLAYSVNDVIVAVQNGGSNLVGEVRLRGCSTDLDNKNTGAAAGTAQIRTVAGGVPLRAHDMLFKSTGVSAGGGAARHMLAWNQGDNINCTIDCAGDWEHFWGGVTYGVYNENVHIPLDGASGLPNVSMWGRSNSTTDYTVPSMRFFDARGGAYAGALPRHYARSIDLRDHMALAGRRQVYAAAPPGTGMWVQGEITWNTAPAAGGVIGWVCVVAGTPGTWKSFGQISA